MVSIGGNEPISYAPTFFIQSGILTAIALALWWMAEIVALLGRIAANTETQLSSAATEESLETSPQ